MMITDALPAEFFGRLANATAAHYGFPRFPASSIREAMSPSDTRLPIMKRCDAGTIWIDRYYIAVQKADTTFRYIYIAKSHILEEAASYRCLKKVRDDPPELPDDIMRQFKKARKYMNYTGSRVYLTKIGEELASPWLEGYRAAEAKAIAAKAEAEQRKKEKEAEKAKEEHDEQRGA